MALTYCRQAGKRSVNERERPKRAMWAKGRALEKGLGPQNDVIYWFTRSIVGLWRSWERASMAWKRSTVRTRPGPPKHFKHLQPTTRSEPRLWCPKRNGQ